MMMMMMMMMVVVVVVMMMQTSVTVARVGLSRTSGHSTGSQSRHFHSLLAGSSTYGHH